MLNHSFHNHHEIMDTLLDHLEMLQHHDHQQEEEDGTLDQHLHMELNLLILTEEQEMMDMVHGKTESMFQEHQMLELKRIYSEK